MKIKHITLNIWQGNLLDTILSFLKKENADIVHLQEVYNGEDETLPKKFRAMDILRRELGFEYSVFHPSFIDTRTIGDIEQGNAIFSKYKIISSKNIFFDVPFGKFDDEHARSWEFEPLSMIHAIISVNNFNFESINVHGIWGLDGKDNKRRIAMSGKIIEEIKDKNNVLLSGDFNAQPNTVTIQNIEKYLLNVFKGTLKTTFNMKHKKDLGYATAVVDMIFVGKNMKVVSKSNPSDDVSDHTPLVVTVDI